MSKIKILLVDDEENLLEATKLYLEKLGQHYQIDTTTSAIKALEILEEIPFDVIISDYQMPEVNGLEFLSKLRESGNYGRGSCLLPLPLSTILMYYFPLAFASRNRCK